MMQEELGIKFGIIFVDDITFITESQEEMEEALRRIIAYLETSIKINKSKTQIWSAQTSAPVNVDGELVSLVKEFKILGMTYAPMAPSKDKQHEFLASYHRIAKVLGNLPMSVAHRANAAAGIQMAASMYTARGTCIWRRNTCSRQGKLSPPWYEDVEMHLF